MGTLRDRFIQLAERITTPLVPADYLDIIDPLAHRPAEGIRVTGHLDGDGGHSVFGDGGQHALQSGDNQVIQH